MDKLKMGEDSRSGRVRALECAVLVAVGLAAFELATLYPSSPEPIRPMSGGVPEGSSWRERDWFFWYNAQQLYRRDPEELTKPQFESVNRWCRCLRLVDQYEQKGLKSMTDDECALVVETLEKRCPNLQEHITFLPVYQACYRRLAATEGLSLVNASTHVARDADVPPAAAPVSSSALPQSRGTP